MTGHGGEKPQHAATEGYQQEEPEVRYRQHPLELDAPFELYSLGVRFISRVLILLQLDAEMPALCAAEASEGSVREAERGDGGRR